jgi:hypothetical protein
MKEYHTHVSKITLLPNKNRTNIKNDLDVELFFDMETGELLNENIDACLELYSFPENTTPLICRICGELLECVELNDKYCEMNGYHQIYNSDLINIGSIENKSIQKWFLRPALVKVSLDGQILTSGYTRNAYELVNNSVKCVKCYRNIKLRELTLTDRFTMQCSLI